MVQYGDADAVLAGGAEATLTAFGFACFQSMQALSPTGISRPFDALRDGFVMGEGAGVLIIEEGNAAEARGATILGEVVGYGSTTDAHHLTAPDPTGGPAARAIELALADAGAKPEEVSYVNAHGTSTQLNDAAETIALKRALGEQRAKRIPVSSTKSAIGHLLGAAGAVEAVATVLALQTRVIPPTLGYEVADPELDLDYVPGEARPLVDGQWRASARSLELVRVRWSQRRLGAARGSGVSATVLHEPAVRLSPTERLEALCDSGSVQVLRSRVLSPRLGSRAVPGDGVLGATATVAGRPSRAMRRTALSRWLPRGAPRRYGRPGAPARGAGENPGGRFVESGGARMQEGIAALAGYARIFRETSRSPGAYPRSRSCLEPRPAAARTPRR